MRIRDWNKSLKSRLIGEVFMNITYWMLFPFLAIYFADEFGKTMAGMLMILSQIFSVTSNLVGGYCADRFGRKRMMVFAATGQGLSFFIFALANSPFYNSPLLAFAGFTLAGVFGAFYAPARDASVADMVPEEHRSVVYAVFYTSFNIAVVIGPILGGIFFFLYRFELLLFATVVCLLLAWILYRFSHESLSPQTMMEMKVKSSGWIGAIKYGNFYIFILAMFIFTMGELLIVGVQQSFISKLAPENMMGQYFAAASLRNTIGRMIAPLSIPMTAWFGFVWTFMILTGLAVVSAFLYLIVFTLFEQKRAASSSL
ncbi:MFS transporter [Neobacillus piezotolerans]|uniref:MFS transporter n=1 Tax=Neobacillus piezotolerans TaxID=2259171 RepID=A0A3D8GNP2_9BACI|nr:MFS transporter [Neobacillus piezotolerans]RDU35696.1 MFS transporter [Neobacillus piezotolerans]